MQCCVVVWIITNKTTNKHLNIGEGKWLVLTIGWAVPVCHTQHRSVFDGIFLIDSKDLLEKPHRLPLMVTRPPTKTRRRTAALPAGKKLASQVGCWCATSLLYLWPSSKCSWGPPKAAGVNFSFCFWQQLQLVSCLVNKYAQFPKHPLSSLLSVHFVGEKLPLQRFPFDIH